MNEALVETAPTRLGGVVTALDRLFPVVWIGVYLLLPVSGWAGEMFDSWFDQRRDLEALRSLVVYGHADAIADSVVGPAYIGSAALLHEVLGLGLEDSLVALTRASYALSVAAALVLVRILVTRIAQAPVIVSLSSQVAFTALVFAAGTWYWSDVPWSHFFAMLLGVSLFVARFGPARPTAAHAALAGMLLALLATTRSFELLALVLAWGITALGLTALRIPAGPVASARSYLVGLAAFLVTTAAVYGATGKRDVFFLYSNHLDHQSGSVPSADIAETPTFSLALVPVKLVQLFADPCYFSLCTVSDYDVHGGRNVDLWSLPLGIQLPSLLLLPICVVGVAIVLAKAVRRRASFEFGRELRLLLELTIASSGLVVGYAASTMTGPSHLRYGFARDFLLASLLTAVVAVVLGSWLTWSLLAGRSRALRLTPEMAFVATTVAAAVLVVGGTAYARANGLPRIESRQLASVRYTAQCSGGRCGIDLQATTRRGAAISIPEASTLTFGCGSDQARFTVYVAHPTAGFSLARPCSDPRLVAAWPTVMGLPPGVFELAAVDVENA